ncbi:MAG TPA: diacylglycerol kinase family protein [Acidimicrobiales bacterium]|nr:diacylglycerol kinase family protein [Acidimicrobiales bacterium]
MSRSCWLPGAEVVMAGGTVVALGRSGRARSGATVACCWVAGRLWATGVGDQYGGWAGLAYGLGRVSPALRTPLALAYVGGLLADVGPARRRRVLAAGLSSLAAGAATAAGVEWLGPRAGRRRRVPVQLVVNRDSGSARLARRARRALEREAEVLSERRVCGPGLESALKEVVGELRSRPGSRLVVAGGDGTVGKALEVASRAGVPVAILPTGTGNDIGRALGVPLYPEEAAAVAVRGTMRRVDLVQTNLGTFAHAAGAGILARFAGLVRDVSGWRRPMVYPARAWRAWRERAPLPLEVATDGEVVALPGPPVEVALLNAPRIGGRIGLPLPAARPDDGRMEVVAVHRGSARNAVVGLAHYLRARPAGPPVGGVAWPARRVELRSPVPFAVSLDGEPVGETTELSALVLPGVATVVVPRRWRRRGTWRQGGTGESLLDGG